MVLPLAAVVLLRTYEGMLLVGPVLALWAVVAGARAHGRRARRSHALGRALLPRRGRRLGGFSCAARSQQRSGLPREHLPLPRNPQVFLLLSALLVLPAIGTRGRRVRIACGITSAAARGAAFVSRDGAPQATIASTSTITTASFLVLMLPAFVGAVFAVYRPPTGWRPGPRTLRHHPRSLGFAIAGDAVARCAGNEFMKPSARCWKPTGRRRAIGNAAEDVRAHGVAVDASTMSVLLRDGAAARW
jgi:hypothetical protein